MGLQQDIGNILCMSIYSCSQQLKGSLICVPYCQIEGDLCTILLQIMSDEDEKGVTGEEKEQQKQGNYMECVMLIKIETQIIKLHSFAFLVYISLLEGLVV